MANLAFGRRVTGNYNNFAQAIPFDVGYSPTLLLPPLTDVRDQSCGGPPDYVEVPAGSNRFYIVGMVDDIGKGFPNEHRAASLFKVFQDIAGGGTYPGYFWPVPIP